MSVRSFGKKFLVFVGLLLVCCAGYVYHFIQTAPDPTLAINTFPTSSKIYDVNGQLLYEIHGETKRLPVDLDQIPAHFVHATLVAEDKGFYYHPGVSPTAIARAVYKNYKAGNIVQGGSTITQQLVKNIYAKKEKSYSRKAWEALMAIKVETVMTKEEILANYLNIVPYGRNTYGVEAAANAYFNINSKDLSLAQSAYLAALPKSPSYLSPRGKHVDELVKRKDAILAAMHKEGYITEEQLKQATGEKVVFVESKTQLLAPHFVEWVIDDLKKKYGMEYLQNAGLNITTTLDIDLQKKAEASVAEFAEANARRYNAHNASLVAIDHKTGEVRAMVGSKNYFAPTDPKCKSGKNCRFDPMTNVAISPRQSGSSFKIYTYITAFSKEFGYSPASLVWDHTENFAKPGAKPYIPRNYDRKERGIMTIRKALAGSLNVPAVRTIRKVGVPNVAATAHAMGITSPLESCGLSLTLGACEVRLVDHTAGFGVVANMGKKVSMHSIKSIKDRNGELVFQADNKEKEVIDPASAYQMISILTDNKARQYIFGRSSRYLVLGDRVVGAKTGTSQDFKDGWTMGFTTELTTGVWVGNNDGSLMRRGADGVVTAAPIWHSFMKKAHETVPAADFQVPSTITKKKINPYTGKFVSEKENGVWEVVAPFSLPKNIDNPRRIQQDENTGRPKLLSIPAATTMAPVKKNHP